MGWRTSLFTTVCIASILDCNMDSRVMDEAHTILTGAEILTLDPETPHAEALAVGDGKILALGSESEVFAAARGPATRVIDLGGLALVPSFKDHHLHVLDLGLSLLNARLEEALFLDLSNARSR